MEKKAAEDVFILREDNTPLKQLYVSTEADLREEIKQKDVSRLADLEIESRERSTQIEIGDDGGEGGTSEVHSSRPA